MDKRILAVLLALGVTPGALAQDTSGNSSNGSIVIPAASLKLHALTKLILQKLKEQGALTIMQSEAGVHVIILGDKLDDEFFMYLSQLKNVSIVEGSKELVVSDQLAAALATFGELTDVLPQNEDEELVRELQKKMGTDLDKTLKQFAGASFA